MFGRERSPHRGAGSRNSLAGTMIGAAPQAAAPNVPDWLTDLFPAQAGASLPTAVAKPLEVPQGLVNQLQMNSEEMLKSLAAETGAQLTLRQDTRNFGYSLVLFSGSTTATNTAKEKLQAKLGLTKAASIMKTVDLRSRNSTAFAALRPHLATISAKYQMMPIQLLAPAIVGAPFQAKIGPGPLSTVSMVESALRRQLREIELEIYSRAGHRVPTELKYAMMCKLTLDGMVCGYTSCVFCHTEEELKIATSCHWENVTKPEELTGQANGDQPLALSLSPTSVKISAVAPKAPAKPAAARTPARILTAKDLPTAKPAAPAATNSGSTTETTSGLL